MSAALRKNLPSVVFSVLVNAAVLFGLALIQRAVASQGLDLMLESVFSEEIPQEEMTRDLDLDTAPAETLNVIAGGTPSTAVGAAAAQPATTAVNVQKAAVMKEMSIRPVVSGLAVTVPETAGVSVDEDVWPLLSETWYLTGVAVPTNAPVHEALAGVFTPEHGVKVTVPLALTV